MCTHSHDLSIALLWVRDKKTLLSEPHYVAFLAQTHPALRLSMKRFAVPTYFAHLCVDDALAPGLLKTGARGVGLILPQARQPKALMLGTPFERYEQSELLDSLDAHHANQTLRALGAQERVDLVALTNISPEHPRLAEWLRLGFVALPSFPDMVMTLNRAQTWDSYLGLLEPRVRESVRRNLRSFDGAQHRLECLENTAEVAPKLYEAYRHFYDRAQVPWLKHSEAYFAGLSALGPGVRVTVARNRSQEVIGFIINFVDAKTWQAGRIGVVPAYFKQNAIYFRLLYHAIEEAIANGADALSLEPTSYRVKRRLGAVYRPMVNLVLGVSPLWRALLATSAGLAKRALAHLSDPRALERHFEIAVTRP